MRIATWNLARPSLSGVRAARIRRHIRNVDADVWVFTETRDGFSAGSEYTRVTTSSTAADRSNGEHWVSIWSRHPAKALTLVADPERTAAAEVTTTSIGKVVVLGTVLPWLSDGRYPGISGGRAFCAILERQAQEWRRLALEHDGAFVLLGDFNQDLAPRHYYGSKMGRVVLTLELTRSGMKCLTGGNDDPVWKRTGGSESSIDHVCIRDSAHAVSVGVWPAPEERGTRVSDHYGVWVDLA